MAEERKDTIDSAGATGPLGLNQRWTVVRKSEVALR